MFSYMLLNDQSYPSVLKMAQVEQVGIAVLDKNAKIIRTNPKISDIFQHPSESLQGQMLVYLFSPRFRTLSYRQAILDYIVNQNIQGADRSQILMGLRQNGTAFPLDMTLASLETAIPGGGVCLALLKEYAPPASQMGRAAPEQVRQMQQLKQIMADISRTIETPLQSADDLIQALGDRVPANKVALLKEQFRQMKVSMGSLSSVSEQDELVSRNLVVVADELKKRIEASVLGEADIAIQWDIEPDPIYLQQHKKLDFIFDSLWTYLHQALKEVDSRQLQIAVYRKGNKAEIRLTHNGQKMIPETREWVFDPAFTFDGKQNQIYHSLWEAMRTLYLLNGVMTIDDQAEREVLLLTLPRASYRK